MAKPISLDTLTIINDQAKLLTAISSVHKTGQTYKLRAHEALVSALHLLAKDGYTKPMNALFDGLPPALQTAIKLYCQTHCSFDFEVLEDGEVVKKREFWLKHTNKDGWSILAGKAKTARDEFANSPAQFLSKPFYDTKVEGKAVVTFNDEELSKRLDNLIKLMTKDGAEVSKRSIDILTKARKELLAA